MHLCTEEPYTCTQFSINLSFPSLLNCVSGTTLSSVSLFSMSGSFSFEPLGGQIEKTIGWGKTVVVAIPGWACISIRAALCADRHANHVTTGKAPAWTELAPCDLLERFFIHPQSCGSLAGVRTFCCGHQRSRMLPQWRYAECLFKCCHCWFILVPLSNSTR